jgi:hypothetical protein
MSEPWDSAPSEVNPEPTNVTPFRKLKLMVFGSDLRDALANQAQHELAVELAKLDRIASADAGKPDEPKGAA